MRKLSQINESLWKSGIDRSKTGSDRLENKFTSNVKGLEEIDLGLSFLIADDDLIINGKDEITPDDFSLYKDEIEKSGWRLPTYDEICDNFIYAPGVSGCWFDLEYSTAPKNKRLITITSKLTRQFVNFIVKLIYGQNYLADKSNRYPRDTSWQNFSRSWFINDPKTIQNPNEAFISVCTVSNDDPVKIRLVKDKK